MVNPEAFLITNEYVRQALDKLIQVTSDRDINPLQYLQLVEGRLLSADHTFFSQPRQFALSDLLISVIQERYNYHRQLHGLAIILPGANTTLAANTVKADSRTANPTLIGWSWLYFHYVESALHISQQYFCELVNLDERTIRRYQKVAIDQLTKNLIRMEQDARTASHKQKLFLQLPHQGNISNLLEREQQLEELHSSKSKHIHVIGALGIGKTVFTEFFIQELIANDQLDHIVWVQSPETIENLKSHINERLLIENNRITLADFLSIKKVAIVIDDAEHLLSDLPTLDSLLCEFSNGYVLLTSHIFFSLPDCYQLTLRELSSSSAKVLLATSNTNHIESLQQVDFNRMIWQSIGGNPLALKLLAQNWSIFDIEVATKVTLEQVYLIIYDSLKTSERLAWLILALLNTHTITLNDLSHIGSFYVSTDDFVTLIRLYVVTTIWPNDKPSLCLTLSSNFYIRQQYSSDFDLQNAFFSFVYDTRWIENVSTNVHLPLIESILSTNWIQIRDDYLVDITQQLWREGILRGHYTKWYEILSKYNSEITLENMELGLGLGICLRYLGQWTKANSIFVQLIQYTGHQGYFLVQAEALLEFAILSRYRGDYHGVIEALNHIEVLDISRTNTTIRNRLLAERIEFALENNNLSEVRNLLDDFPDGEPRKNIFQIELYTKLIISSAEIDLMESSVERLLFQFSYSRSIIARIHILLGRIREKILDFTASAKHLSIALSLLTEEDNDPYALARAQSNLASVLINQDQLTAARELLNSAKYIQNQIGDRVGLAVTMHNSHVIDRKIVK
ncbi:MAG: hypothetical protein GC179_02710 [Anaerolineaceae bacterium]|nr:hypothetical protein [Anaerolineaceae bacterium]